MTDERRKYVRVPAQSVLRCERYTIPRVAGPERKEAVALNLSAGGILFISVAEFKKGELLRIELELENWEKYKAEFYKPDQTASSKPFVVIGTVVHSELRPDGKFDIGVNFSGMDEGHRWALIKYLKDKVKN